MITRVSILTLNCFRLMTRIKTGMGKMTVKVSNNATTNQNTWGSWKHGCPLNLFSWVESGGEKGEGRRKKEEEGEGEKREKREGRRKGLAPSQGSDSHC